MLSIVQDSANRDLARTVINNYETIVPPLYKNIETGIDSIILLPSYF